MESYKKVKSNEESMGHRVAGSGPSGPSGKRDSKRMRMGDPLLAPSQGILGKHPSKHSPLVLQ